MDFVKTAKRRVSRALSDNAFNMDTLKELVTPDRSVVFIIF